MNSFKQRNEIQTKEKLIFKKSKNKQTFLHTYIHIYIHTYYYYLSPNNNSNKITRFIIKKEKNLN